MVDFILADVASPQAITSGKRPHAEKPMCPGLPWTHGKVFMNVGTLMTRRGKHVLLLLVVALTAVILGLAASPAARSSLALTTTRSPEPLTELSFTRPGNLAKTFTAGAVQPVTFTVHNLEGRPNGYTYTVLADDHEVATGRTHTLGDGDAVAITRPIRITSTKPEVKVEVRLVGTAQSIHYWTTNLTRTRSEGSATDRRSKRS